MRRIAITMPYDRCEFRSMNDSCFVLQMNILGNHIDMEEFGLPVYERNLIICKEKVNQDRDWSLEISEK